MTHAQLKRLTVPQLRGKCRKAGLPSWQSGGKRLTKPDLVAALTRHSRRKAKPRKKPARRLEALQKPPRARESAVVTTLAEQLIARVLGDLPCDPTYSRAMHRIMRGGKAAKDRMILQRKRLVAIGTLRDGAPDEPGRAFWADKYAAEMNVAGC